MSSIGTGFNIKEIQAWEGVNPELNKVNKVDYNGQRM